MKIKVDVRAVFMTSEGVIKADGPLASLPMNPWAESRWPRFHVSFNHRWHEVEIVDADPTYGWVAMSVAAINSKAAIAPAVELRKRRGGEEE